MNDFASRNQFPRRPEELIIDMLTTSQLSRNYGVTPRALRFYEQRGLLKPIRRGGARILRFHPEGAAAIDPKGQATRVHAHGNRRVDAP